MKEIEENVPPNKIPEDDKPRLEKLKHLINDKKSKSQSKKKDPEGVPYEAAYFHKEYIKTIYRRVGSKITEVLKMIH